MPTYIITTIGGQGARPVTFVQLDDDNQAARATAVASQSTRGEVIAFRIEQIGIAQAGTFTPSR